MSLRELKLQMVHFGWGGNHMGKESFKVGEEGEDEQRILLLLLCFRDEKSKEYMMRRVG